MFNKLICINSNIRISFRKPSSFEDFLINYKKHLNSPVNLQEPSKCFFSRITVETSKRTVVLHAR